MSEQDLLFMNLWLKMSEKRMNKLSDFNVRTINKGSEISSVEWQDIPIRGICSVNIDEKTRLPIQTGFFIC